MENSSLHMNSFKMEKRNALVTTSNGPHRLILNYYTLLILDHCPGIQETEKHYG